MAYNMKILLTGGSGMVGMNIRDKLDVLAPTSQELNLLSLEDCQTYIHHVRPDIVIHAAGKVGGIQANINNQFEYLYANAKMGENILLASHRYVRHFINLGSSCMYPKDAAIPFVEDSLFTGKPEPTNDGYATAKLYVHKMGIFLSDHKFKFTTLIPCNLYGHYDKYDPDMSHLVASVIKKVRTANDINAPNVEIWGSGEARREVMFAADLAEFIVFILDKLGSLPVVMNVGTGIDYSIKEYYQIIAGVIGYQGKFIYNPDKPEGMTHKLLNIQKQKQLGWAPTTDLATGIKEIASMRKYTFWHDFEY